MVGVSMYNHFINYVIQTDNCQSNFIQTLNGVDAMIDMLKKLGISYGVRVFSDGTEEGIACAKVIEMIMSDPNHAAIRYSPDDREAWADAINFMKPEAGARFIRKVGATVTITSDGYLYFRDSDRDMTIKKGIRESR